MAQSLKASLENLKDFLVKGEIQRVREFQSMIKKILAEQEERKERVASKLKAFQKEQKEMAKRLKELLVKGEELRIKDFELMLEELKGQTRMRIDYQEEEREEVRRRLSDFKEEKLEAARNWEVAQRKMTQKRTTSTKI
jgi:hypothetical protein